MTTLFGTDGIRKQVGHEPLTLDHISRCGLAIARWAVEKYGSHPHIMLSHDTRNSAHWIIAALQSGLLLHPTTVHYAGIMPTPALCKLLQLENQFHLGIIISASHNPYHDNGIKLVDAFTGKLSHDEEMRISDYYHNPITPSYQTFGSITSYNRGIEEYTKEILTLFDTQLLAHLTIVLDCANGATYTIAPHIFSQLGAHVITINNNPNGININHESGALHLESLQKAVIQHNATIGFAFDGDGDRVIVVSQQGVIKNGDDILALLSEHPHYCQQKEIVGTTMSNHGLELYLKERNKTLARTQVGDKYVSDYLESHNGLLGGEQSGHIILHDYLQTGDGIVTALKIIELVLSTGNWNLETFYKYPQRLISIPVVVKKDLQDPAISKLIAEYQAQLNSGRLVIRYSGTENVLRIMIEDKEEEQVEKISNNLANALRIQLQ